ncbi:MAG: M16 family metallopeptidase [Armatimonadaceae bacterium]
MIRKAFQDTLPDGTRIVVVPEPAADAVGMAVHVRVTDADAEGRDGMCSLAAECLGKETPSRTGTLLRGAVESSVGFGVDCDPWGVSLWAGSRAESTEIARTARLLVLDTLANPTFSAENLANARAALGRRAALLGDDPVATALAIATRKAFGNGSGPSIDQQSLARIGPSQLDAFHRTFFVPERTTIAIHGRVEPDSLRTLVRSLLSVGDWGRRPKARFRSIPDFEPDGNRPRDITVARRGGLGLATLTWVGPGTDRGTAAVAEAALLDTLAGDGKGSRLFGVRERTGMVYEIRSRWVPGPRASLMQWWCVGDTSGKDLRDALLGAARGIAAADPAVSSEELDRAKGLLLGRRRTSADHPVWRARRTASAIGLGMGEFEAGYAKWIAEMDSVHLGKAAAQWFSMPPLVVRTN